MADKIMIDMVVDLNGGPPGSGQRRLLAGVEESRPYLGVLGGRDAVLTVHGTRYSRSYKIGAFNDELNIQVPAGADSLVTGAKCRVQFELALDHVEVTIAAPRVLKRRPGVPRR